MNSSLLPLRVDFDMQMDVVVDEVGTEDAEEERQRMKVEG